MTEMTMKERVARAINEGLGESWSYSNYRGNEWERCRDMLDRAADEAIAVAFEEAAKIAETPDRTERGWVPDSLWDNISRETAARMRKAARS